MIAENDVDLANKISHLGYFLTKFRTVQDTESARLKMPRLKHKELLQFTFQLATLVDAGLPLLEGLRDLAQEAGSDRIQRVIDDIRYRVEGGSSLKESMLAHPRTFSKVYTAIIGTGEATGKLSQTLNDLAELLEWQMDLQTKIKEAATYPIILFCVMIAVVTLLVVKVIPAFEPIFQQARVSLPLPTQIVLGVSAFVRTFWFIILAIMGSITVLYKVYYATEVGHYNADSVKLKMPIFGDVIRKVALSRFTHTFALGFKSGVNLLSCMDIAGETTGNARVERAITKARNSVNVGEKLATSLAITGEFPAMVIRMVGVGEQSGSLSQTLMKVAVYYDKEVATAIKRMFALFEPLMIVIAGVVVGGIALSIFLPMFQMAQIMGG